MARNGDGWRGGLSAEKTSDNLNYVNDLQPSCGIVSMGVIAIELVSREKSPTEWPKA